VIISKYEKEDDLMNNKNGYIEAQKSYIDFLKHITTLETGLLLLTPILQGLFPDEFQKTYLESLLLLVTSAGLLFSLWGILNLSKAIEHSEEKPEISKQYSKEGKFYVYTSFALIFIILILFFVSSFVNILRGYGA
jgi:TRAP-type C4-dicarboxylate transport system permease small subunit